MEVFLWSFWHTELDWFSLFFLVPSKVHSTKTPRRTIAPDLLLAWCEGGTPQRRSGIRAAHREGRWQGASMGEEVDEYEHAV